MGIFREYSKYYNLLYKDKDYEKEAGYVDHLIKRYVGRNKKNLLNIGCGTGQHDRWFADNGYKVVGIDRSPEMIKIAKKMAASDNNGIEFYISDATDFKLNRKFDIAVALFHVMSYQTTNKSVLCLLKNAYEHLNKSGLLIFDFWYGPGVLAQRPSVRTKSVSEDGIQVARTAIPKINVKNDTVDIEFRLAIDDKRRPLNQMIVERHQMRYFFLPELELMSEDAGFKKTVFLKWMSYKNDLDEKAWSGIAIAQK